LKFLNGEEHTTTPTIQQSDFPGLKKIVLEFIIIYYDLCVMYIQVIYILYVYIYVGEAFDFFWAIAF